MDDDIFADLYLGAVRRNLNHAPLMSELPGDFVPPPRWKRWRYRLRAKVRTLRERTGFWIAGYTPEEW